MAAFCSILSLILYISKTSAIELPTNASTSCTQFASDPSDVDIYLFCRLFEATNIMDLIHEYNFSTNTYCDPWYFDYNFEIDFDCSNNRTSMRKISLTDDYFGGKLITSQPWPPFIQEIDLETPGDKTDTTVQRFEGVWNWSTFTQLHHLYEFSIKNNNFSGVITNQDWNNIVSMHQLKVLVLAQNYFKSNLSDIHINKTSSIYELQLMDNLLFGSVDTTKNGFFSSFPNLQIFVTDNNPDLGGYFENLDALSELEYFEIENNQFSGSITLSNTALSLSSLIYFNIGNNSFFGDIEWEIFADSKELTTLLLSHNHFEGIIDWKTIGDLSSHRLRTLELDDNIFDGFANFEYIDIDSNIKIRLDIDIICDPSIYVCGGDTVATNRSSVECEGKIECGLTCKCSDGSIAILAKVVTTQVEDYETTEDDTDSNKIEFDLLVISGVLVIGAFGIVLCICLVIVVKRIKPLKKKTKHVIVVNRNNANYQFMNL